MLYNKTERWTVNARRLIKKPEVSKVMLYLNKWNIDRNHKFISCNEIVYK